jgi:hypothetical protein
VTHHHDPAVLEIDPLEVQAGLQAGTVTLLDIRSQALFERWPAWTRSG